MVFSDNAASFAALKELAEQREALAARRNELEERLAAHRECCQVGIAAPFPTLQPTDSPRA